MYSQKGFKYAMYALSLFLIAIVFAVLTIKLKYDSVSLVLGVLVISVGIFGFIASLRGIKEKNSFKKIVGLVINSFLPITILIILIAKIYDIYRAFN